MNLKVIPAGGGPQPPSIASFPLSGTVGTSILITGENFTGANGGVYRSLNGGSSFVRSTGLPAAADYGDP